MSFLSWLSDLFGFGSRKGAGWMDNDFTSPSTSLFDDDSMNTSSSLFDHSWDTDESSITHVNPATGLPMCGGIGGVDVAGNPYGFNNDDCSSTSTSMFDDWSSSGSSFNDW